jgi:hypothetical protein
VPAPSVTTFFYGSYMNLDVLREVDLVPASVQVARLDGYDIRIEPLANLVVSDRACVFGILADATHEELARLYAHAEHVLGGVYLPRAVLTRRADDAFVPALCYIAPDLPPGRADPAYVERILKPARDLDFPAWYVERLAAFKPRGG